MILIDRNGNVTGEFHDDKQGIETLEKLISVPYGTGTLSTGEPSDAPESASRGVLSKEDLPRRPGDR